MEKLTIKKNELCFENIINLIISFVAYPIALATYHYWNLSVILNDGKCYFPGKPNTTNKALETHVRNIFIYIQQHDSLPDKIEFEVLELKTSPPFMENPKNIKLSQKYNELSAISIYVSFYEKVKDLIKRKYGDNHSSWPDTLNVARIVRNALAHDNKINITNKNSKTFNWRHLSYGLSDNGKNIIFSDFLYADLIFLMKDVSDTLIIT